MGHLWRLLSIGGAADASGGLCLYTREYIKPPCDRRCFRRSWFGLGADLLISARYARL